jgi:hypothetical protein
MPFFIDGGPHHVDNGPVPLPWLMLSLYASTMAQWQDEPSCCCCCNGCQGVQRSFVVTLSLWKILWAAITILLLSADKPTKTIVCCYPVIVEDSLGSPNITILLLSAYKPTKMIVCCYSVILEDSVGSPKITILLLSTYKPTKTIVCCYSVIVEDSLGSLNITILLLSAYKPTTPLPNPPPA